MDSSKKLTSGQVHVLLMVRRDMQVDGWTPVSFAVAPFFTEPKIAPPAELFEFRQSQDKSGLVKLTDKGNNVLDSMEYLW